MSKYILKRALKWTVLLFAAISAVYFILSLAPGDPGKVILEKPVIMLYPEKETVVTVRLKGNDLATTYPIYNDGWTVTAHPDGRLEMDGRSYRCLFWEAENNFEPDFSSGFCVKGQDTAAFLEKKLAFLGLNEDEANDFIVYWLPRMENNPYNLISFQTDNYEKSAPLEITPAPDSLLRVFMAFKKADKFYEIDEQELVPFERVGFAAVEWGGCEVK